MLTVRHPDTFKTCEVEQRAWLPRLRHRRHFRRTGVAEERHCQRHRLVRVRVKYVFDTT